MSMLTTHFFSARTASNTSSLHKHFALSIIGSQFSFMLGIDRTEHKVSFFHLSPPPPPYLLPSYIPFLLFPASMSSHHHQPIVFPLMFVVSPFLLCPLFTLSLSRCLPLAHAFSLLALMRVLFPPACTSLSSH